MLRRTLALGTCLAATLVVGCQDQTTAPAISPISPSARSTSALSSSLLGSGFARAPFAAPAAMRIVDRMADDVVARAINPGDYPSCSSASPVSDWFGGEIDKIFAENPDYFFAVYNRFADLVPTYEAFLFESEATPQSFGYNGEYTHSIVKAERGVKAFWDINSANIEVVAMHGTTLLDTLKTAATYEVLGLPTSWAKTVRSTLLASTSMNGGNHPLFTFNSVAFEGIEEWGIPPKVVMGDGILAAYDAIGFGDVAPEAIFAHEFGHQIQFANGYFNDAAAGTSAPEQTRYTELMADAFSAYYLTHKRGAALNQKRVAEFLEVFYDIGDCAFTDPGHHGTPGQRMAAAQFGFDIANEAQKQGHILGAEAFHALFVAKYPDIIAPEKALTSTR
jgi:hypothetical protein